MSATKSHLQLEGYFLKELSYSLKSELDRFPTKVEKTKPVDLAISNATVVLDPESNKWRSELTVSSIDDFAYDFRITMVGFFSVSDKLDPNTSRMLAETNGPAVLYSAAREIIATVTRRSPVPATVLPLVTFVKSPPGVVGAKSKKQQKKK